MCVVGIHDSEALYRSRSLQLAVTVFADRPRGIRSAAQVLALGEESSGELWIGEEWPSGQRRRRNDLGEQASAFGDINLSRRRPPDPSARRQVEFPDRDSVHVTHCVTFVQADQSINEQNAQAILSELLR